MTASKPHSELVAEVRDFIDSYAIGSNQQTAASVAFDGLVEQLEATFTERETRCIARVLEPSRYPMEGEDFTDIINEALRGVWRVMDSIPASEPHA